MGGRGARSYSDIGVMVDMSGSRGGDAFQQWHNPPIYRYSNNCQGV